MQSRTDKRGQTDLIGLRRGVCDRQRDGASDGNQTEMGGLHPKGEPDNFDSSHCCLSTRRLWLGARLVRKHRRVPFNLKLGSGLLLQLP
jgi:hypothetical protein